MVEAVADWLLAWAWAAGEAAEAETDKPPPKVTVVDDTSAGADSFVTDAGCARETEEEASAA